MQPDSFDTWGLALPVLAMSAVGAAVIGTRLKQLIWKKKQPKRKGRGRFIGANAALGFAFLTLPVIYSPGLSLVVKAQIRQQEDVDEDEDGDPESPAKHLLRQFRRIRRGEPVERLTLRL